ncbi:MAG: septum formation initiator family protein [Gammaproteobacteria bacterium]|nr:septum formation initiator family protein [Gammaproteobacteria bacterium]
MLQRVVIGVLLLLLIALQVRLWTGKGSLAEVAELEQRLEVRRAENRRLIEHNAVLEAEVRALKEDPDSLEARARSELGMIREGETFFMVVPRKGAPGTDPDGPRDE